MGRSRLELADVVRAHRADLERSRGPLAASEGRVLSDITRCRTNALGGHVERCEECGHEHVSYNSCRNRHCPKCLNGARADWLRERESELLPVEYFHVVFTLPHELSVLAAQNKQLVYELLLRTAAGSLTTIAADPKHLGAQIGVLAILHTWGQSLEHHPHAHCVVTGGGLSSDETRWIPCRPGFFLPVRVLSRLYRGRFLALLKGLFDRGELTCEGSIQGLQDQARYRPWIADLRRKDWVVYAKAPFGSPSRVLRYLGRYTHRVAISNQRLVSMSNGMVSFLWKDYAHGCRKRVMTLTATEFLRRFLLHVLPRGFVRIRHYGLLANRHRERKLERCRELLAARRTEEDVRTSPRLVLTCTSCGKGRMQVVLHFEPEARLPRRAPAVAIDTS